MMLVVQPVAQGVLLLRPVILPLQQVALRPRTAIKPLAQRSNAGRNFLEVRRVPIAAGMRAERVGIPHSWSRTRQGAVFRD